MKTLQTLCISLVFSFYTSGILAQNIDELVAKHIEAIGGRDNWNKLSTLRTESVMKAQGADIKFTVYQIDNKAMRQDINVMGMTGFSILNNQEGWVYMPWQGHTKSEAMTADDVKNAQDDLSLKDEFLTYKEKGKKLDYYGMDDIDGIECHKLKMTGSDGKEITFYINPENYYVIKKTEKVQSNGQEIESSSFYSDHRKTNEGLVFPMSISSGWGESEITRLDINPLLEASLFKPSK